MRWTSLVLCIALVGCAAKPRVAVRAGEVLAHGAELGREGTASLATIVVKGEDTRPSDRVNVTLDQPILFHGSSTTLLALMQGCAPFAGSSPCALVDKSDIIYLRAFRFREGKPDPSAPKTTPSDRTHELKVAMGVLSLASFTGMGMCIAYCTSYRTEKSVALGGTGLVFGIIWALIGSNVRD